MSLRNNAWATRQNYLRGLRDLMLHLNKSKGQKTRTVHYGRELRKTLCTYCKVLGYVHLTTNSHRVAITNGRILDVDRQNVRFAYKDYADGAKRKEMTLTGIQFLHRFCLHFLPPRFRKIRQFGFLANACKARNLARARKALGLKQRLLLSRTQRKSLAKERLFDQQTDRCPCCRQGQMVVIGVFAPNKDPPLLGLPYLQ